MKRFMLCLLLFPLAVMAQAPSFPVRLDLQSQSRTFALKWAAGSSPILSAYVSDGGRAYTNLSGWTGYVYVAVTPTAGVYVAASPVASNRVNFSFTASQTATVGTFNVEVVLGNGTNTYRWGTGSLALSNSPALLGAGTVPLTGIFNWDLYTFTGTQPPLSASYTNALAGDVTGVPGATVIGDGVVGTNNLDAETRGLLSSGSGINTNSAPWTGLVARVTSVETTANAALNTNSAPWTGLVARVTNVEATAAGALPKSGGTLTGPIVVSNITGGVAGAFPATGISLRLKGGPDYAGTVFAPVILDSDIVTTGRTLFASSINSPITSAGAGSGQLLINGYDATGGGVAGGSILIRPGVGLGASNGTLIITNATMFGTFGGYLPTDFVLLTTLSTGGYLRITSGAVTSNSMPGTRGEYRRTTTNAYFHDGSQWVTWSVSTNFSH